MRQILAILAIIIAIALRPSEQSAEYLREKPAYMKTCRMGQTDFNECVRQAFSNIYTNWGHGIANVPSSKPIDPLFVEEMAFIQDERGASSVPSMSVTMHNLTVTGLSTTNLTTASFKQSASDANVYQLRFENFTPSMRIRGKYSAVGNLFILKIDSHGQAMFDTMNGTYTVKTRLDLVSRDNNTFFDLTTLHFALNHIDGVHLNFENLFRDKMLSDSTNAVFNENWRMFYEIFQETIERVIGQLLHDHYRSVFNLVPATYFVGDLKASRGMT